VTVSVACHFAVNSFTPRAVDKRSHSNRGSAFTIAKLFNIRPARPEFGSQGLGIS
jgi:hypothetical protein